MALKARTPFNVDRYMRLVRRFPLLPITSERQLDEAIGVIDELTDRKLSADEQAYLDVLSDLVERYEDAHYVIEAADDAEILTDLLESKGLTQAAFARETGIAESTVSAVLGRSRQLTRAHMAAIGRCYNVPAGVFRLDE